MDGTAILEPHRGVKLHGAPSVRCHRAGKGGRSVAELRSLAGPAGAAVTFRMAFDTDTLPWLQTWHQPLPGMHVLGIEPSNSERGPNGESVPDPACELGAWSSRTFSVELSLSDG